MKSFWGFKTCSASFEVLGLAVAMIAGAAFQSPCQAGTVTFGTGGNQFSMEFVTIGNPGNAADTTGAPNPAGAVGYEYGLGKFEVSRDMILKFNSSQSLQITLQDMSTMGGNGLNKPATGLSTGSIPALGTKRPISSPPAASTTTTLCGPLEMPVTMH
jgi:hypothetical protein